MKNHVSQLQREKESGSDSVGRGKEWLKPPACHFQQTQTISAKPFSLARTARDGRQDGLTRGGGVVVQVLILALLMTFWVIHSPQMP